MIMSTVRDQTIDKINWFRINQFITILINLQGKVIELPVSEFLLDWGLNGAEILQSAKKIHFIKEDKM